MGCYAKAENEEVVGYLFIMPALLVLGTFFVLLILYSIFLSFQKVQLLGNTQYQFVGLRTLTIAGRRSRLDRAKKHGSIGSDCGSRTGYSDIDACGYSKRRNSRKSG